jgi:hypothetical protein
VVDAASVRLEEITDVLQEVLELTAYLHMDKAEPEK